MVVRNECEALCIAEEMEKRAIRVYERALMLTQDASVQEGIRQILQDERRHLQRFNGMRACHPMGMTEEKLLISAMAAEVLFPGGVMEMSREQALDSLKALYQYAAESEAEAVRAYAEFARKCDDPQVREAFLAIVREESIHLHDLRARVNENDSKSSDEILPADEPTQR